MCRDVQGDSQARADEERLDGGAKSEHGGGKIKGPNRSECNHWGIVDSSDPQVL